MHLKRERTVDRCCYRVHHTQKEFQKIDEHRAQTNIVNRMKKEVERAKKELWTLNITISHRIDADANDTNKNNKYQKLGLNLWLRSLEMALQCLCLVGLENVRHDSSSHQQKSMMRLCGEYNMLSHCAHGSFVSFYTISYCV